MMEIQERNQSVLPITALILAVGVGGYFLYEQPFVSYRPEQPEPYPRDLTSSESVDARLWEDPFKAVFTSPQSVGCGGGQDRQAYDCLNETFSHDLDQLAFEVRGRADAADPRGSREAADPEPIVLMAVMVPGEPYAEQAEKRRRTRHAVVSGLGAAGYVPRVGESIGYIDTKWDPSGQIVRRAGRSLRVPFEWFEGDSLRPADERGAADSVLVLWLDESALRDDPLRHVDQLLRHLTGFCYRRTPKQGDGAEAGLDCPADRRRFEFRLLGPATSGTLRRMVEKAHERLSSMSPPADQPAPQARGTVGESEPASEASSLAQTLAKDLLVLAPEISSVGDLHRGAPCEDGSDDGRSCECEADILQRIACRIEAAWEQARDRSASSRQFWPSWLITLEKGIEEDLKAALDRPAAGESDADAETEDRIDVVRASVFDREALIETLLERWIFARREQLVGVTRAGSDDDSILPYLEIYSHRATAPASLLLAEVHGDHDYGKTDEVVRRIFRSAYAGGEDEDAGLLFVPTVLGDDRLAWALVQELERRGVDLCGGDDGNHLALVGEWDTFYSRSFSLAFEAAVRACRSEGGSSAAVPGFLAARLEPRSAGDPLRSGEMQTIHRINYLRGLDGSLPSNRRTDGGRTAQEGSRGGGALEAAWRRGDGTAGAGEAVERLSSRRRLERAAGPRRFDYMRRVAQQLTELNMRLDGDGKSLAAIGVVGSDVYDKLLVLQALRRRFPQALFFTPDLDARLFHPDDYRWNRNLIVASSYGLTLAKPFQRFAPPFRDSYQVASFVATQAALASVGAPPAGSREPRPPVIAELDRMNGTAPECLRGAEVDLARGTGADQRRPICSAGPRIFEIARSGAYEVTPERMDDRPALYPEKRDGLPHPTSVRRSVLASFLAFGLVIPVFPRVRRYALERWSCRDPETRRHILTTDLFVGLALATGLFLAFWIRRDWLSGVGEPFELWEGISIWPTEMLRLAAALLSVILIARAAVLLRENACDLSERFALLPERPGDKQPTFWDGWWQKRRDRRDRRRREKRKEHLAEEAAIRRDDERQRRRELTAGRPGGRPPALLEGATEERRKPEVTVLTHRRVTGNVRRSLAQGVALWWQERCRISINAWRDRRARVPAQSVWFGYLHRGRLSHRLTRLLPVAAVYFVLGSTLVQLFGEPHKPLRGGVAAVADKAVLFTGVFAMIALTFFVVDASRLCERFIERLASCATRWPTRSLLQVQERRSLLVKEDAEDYLDAELIAERTQVVGHLILYPFIILGIMMVSRIGFFDHWDWPLSLILIFGIVSSYALACAIVLRRAAERARERIVERLQEKLSKALSEERTETRLIRAEQIRLLITDVKGLRRGAFAPWTQHPIVKAILIPFGGIGAVILLDLVASIGL